MRFGSTTSSALERKRELRQPSWGLDSMITNRAAASPPPRARARPCHMSLCRAEPPAACVAGSCCWPRRRVARGRRARARAWGAGRRCGPWKRRIRCARAARASSRLKERGAFVKLPEGGRGLGMHVARLHLSDSGVGCLPLGLVTLARAPPKPAPAVGVDGYQIKMPGHRTPTHPKTTTFPRSWP